MSDEYGSVEWAGRFSTKFSGLRETVPDTQDQGSRQRGGEEPPEDREEEGPGPEEAGAEEEARREEGVPDTLDYILWDKIGKSIGVYSGVYEYTANTGTNTEYTEYTRYLGICWAEGRIPAV